VPLDLTPVVLRAGELTATFVPGAGLVGISLRHRGDELLAQRDGIQAYAQSGKTMGIPLLHPWANRLGALEYERDGRRVRLDPERMPLRLEEHGLPNHGVRGSALPWQVTEASDTVLRAQMAYEAEALLAVFPFPHALAVEIALAPHGLRVQTTLQATGDVPVPVAFGYHPYLTLPGAPRDAWRVELPVRRRLVVDASQVPTGEREAVEPYAGSLDGRSFDDGFDEVPDGATFAVEGGGRRLAVTFAAGYRVAQVYAPLREDYVCFEPMTAPADALRTGDGLREVPPGEAFTAAWELAVSAS
jgi:galactose mutarotase-like enzyme